MSAIPKQLVPFRLRIGRAKASTVTLVFLVTVAIVIFVSLVYTYSSQRPLWGAAAAMKTIGVDGDAIGVGILVFSVIVKLYSQDKYVNRYFKYIKGLRENCKEYKDLAEYTKFSDAAIKIILKNFHGILSRRATTVLGTDLGATAIALGTLLKFIGDILTGGFL